MMMDDVPTDPPMVSIIIPCYNHAAYVAEAIDSAIRQTYANIEVIVVDDGSTDDSRSVVARFPSVVYLHQRNQGVSAARNHGLRRSRGRYVIFLDADDRLTPTAAETALSAFAEQPGSAFVFGNVRWINAAGRVTGMPSSGDVGGDLYSALLHRSCIFTPGAVMFRREALEKVGGFDGKMTPCDDYDLYLRLSREHPAHHHSHLVVEYRLHEDNMSGDQLRVAEYGLAALKRQWRFVRGDRERRRAYMAGVHFWVTTYTRYERASLWAASQWRLRGRGIDGLKAAAILARRAPHWFAFQTARQMSRPVRNRLRRLRGAPAAVDADAGAGPPPGHVRFGDLRRVQPLDRYYGYCRGVPVDRHYIERFLDEHRTRIRGRTLEVKDAAYARRFGGPDVIADVVDIDAANPQATLIGDLTDEATLPQAAFDCIILTQTLQLIYDVQAATANVVRALKPGGTLLLSVPGISKTDPSSPVYWSFTEHSVKRLLAPHFAPAPVEVRTRGNVLAANAFLQGMAASELRPEELDFLDTEFPVSIVARATRPEAPAA